MADFDFVYKEDINFDKSLVDNLDSMSKYDLVLRTYKEGRDHSEAFRLGAKYIMYFSKTFENLTVEHFRSMIYKSRSQYKAIPLKSDEDKKLLLFLYLELIKKSTTMTKYELFKSIWSTHELDDYVPFFIYFGRVFANESDYESLRSVVENARIGLKRNFNSTKELLDFESLVRNNLGFLSRKSIPRSENVVFMFKEYDEASYTEVFLSKFKNCKFPHMENVEDYDQIVENSVDEKVLTSPSKDISNVRSENKENSSENISETTISVSANTTMKPSSPTKEEYKKRFGDTSNLEVISFCTNMSNKLASAFSETLPPQDVSLSSETILDETIPPPNFVTPARVSLKRDRKELVLLEEKLSQEKDFSVFEDENFTRTQVYVDQTGDMDCEVLDDDLLRSPLRKKVNCLKNQIKPSNNISTVVEEDDIVMEDLIEKPIEDNVMDSKDKPCQVVSEEIKLSFHSPQVYDNSKNDVCSVVTEGNKSNTGSINSFEFKGSFTIPTKADEEIPTPLLQKNAPRPSLMTASTPCRGSQPMQMDECSFYHDLSEIKGDDDEDLVPKPFGNNGDFSSIVDKDLTIHVSSHKPEVRLLSSPTPSNSAEPPKVNTVKLLFDSSDSHVSESYHSVDLFQVIGNQDKTVSKIIDKDSTNGSGIFSEISEDAINSSCLEKTIINQVTELNKSFPKDNCDMNVVSEELEVSKKEVQNNEEIEMVKEVNIVVEEFEDKCISTFQDVSKTDTSLTSFEPCGETNKSVDTMDICKEEDLSGEQKEAPKIKSIFDVSDSGANILFTETSSLINKSKNHSVIEVVDEDKVVEFSFKENSINKSNDNHDTEISEQETIPKDTVIENEYKLPENTSTNPWDPMLRCALMKLDTEIDKFYKVERSLKDIRVGSVIDIQDNSIKIQSLIAKGGFASVYKVNVNGTLKAGKFETPAYPYETYICEQIRKRCPPEFIKNFMVVDKTYIFDDYSIIINEYISYGTLLDLANNYKKNFVKPTCHVVGYLAIQIAEIMKILKECKIIHADIKPDNFLIIEKPSYPGLEGLLASKNIIKLIDFGRAIDMKPLNNVTFHGKAATDCFNCIEMLDGRPWTYQTDFYGFCVTVYLLLTTQYCYRTTVNGKNSLLGNLGSRQHPMKRTWEAIAEKLLNISDINDMPSWTWVLDKIRNDYKGLIDDYDDEMEDHFKKFQNMIGSS